MSIEKEIISFVQAHLDEMASINYLTLNEIVIDHQSIRYTLSVKYDAQIKAYVVKSIKAKAIKGK